jgi:hypothetical protein
MPSALRAEHTWESFSVMADKRSASALWLFTLFLNGHLDSGTPKRNPDAEPVD